MDYIQGLAEQTEIFFYSLGFGFLLGILYDVFRTLRMIISRSKGFTFFMDLLYFAVCAVLTFCFIMVVDSGKVRIYVALGEALGWLIYYFSFGAIAIKVSGAVVRGVRSAFSAISKPFRRIFGKIRRKFMKIAAFLKKNIRKSDKKTKFILQKHRSIVYNLNRCVRNNLIEKKESTDDFK